MPESLARTTLRRASRATLVACVVFYAFRYGRGQPTAATYGLFGAVALGAFAQVAGSPWVRVRTLLACLPVGWLLIAAGTWLAATNIGAAVGMLVLGFAVSYSGVGGPRVAGVVNALQLLYILACFPPYAPATLGERLLGYSVAVLLLGAAERVLWPGPVPETFEHRLSVAVAALGGRIRAEGERLAGRAPDRARPDPELVGRMEGLKPSQLPSEMRPASAGRRDHALSHAAGTARYTTARVADLAATPDGMAELRPAVSVLLGQTADAVDRAAGWLAAGKKRGPARGDPDPGVIAAIDAFRERRRATSPDGLPPDQLRQGSLALAVADGARVVVTALSVAAAGHPVSVQSGQGSFWYAGRSSVRLWWDRLREHLTPRSVYFQGALRLALALAFARLVAGALDLTHGFWVLLAILTVLRASAAATRAVLWPSLLGTVIGAGLAGLLLALVVSPTVYAALLPVVMFVGFAAGPLLGVMAGQALFTLVIATVFAQLEPAHPNLAEVRLLDVALGGVIGVLVGLCAWPRGGAGEMHRASGNFLADCAAAIRATVASMGGGRGGAPPVDPAPVLAEARHDGQLADASFALYQSETRRRYAPSLDWQATLMAGHHVVRGAEGLLRAHPDGTMRIGPLGVTASSVAAGYDAVAAQLLTHRTIDVPPFTEGSQAWPTGLGARAYHLADLWVWLDGVGDDLTRLRPQATDAPTAKP